MDYPTGRDSDEVQVPRAPEYFKGPAKEKKDALKFQGGTLDVQLLKATHLKQSQAMDARHCQEIHDLNDAFWKTIDYNAGGPHQSEAGGVRLSEAAVTLPALATAAKHRGLTLEVKRGEALRVANALYTVHKRTKGNPPKMRMIAGGEVVDGGTFLKAFELDAPPAVAKTTKLIRGVSKSNDRDEESVLTWDGFTEEWRKEALKGWSPQATDASAVAKGCSLLSIEEISVARDTAYDLMSRRHESERVSMRVRHVRELVALEEYRTDLTWTHKAWEGVFEKDQGDFRWNVDIFSMTNAKLPIDIFIVKPKPGSDLVRFLGNIGGSPFYEWHLIPLTAVESRDQFHPNFTKNFLTPEHRPHCFLMLLYIEEPPSGDHEKFKSKEDYLEKHAMMKEFVKAMRDSWDGKGTSHQLLPAFHHLRDQWLLHGQPYAARPVKNVSHLRSPPVGVHHRSPADAHGGHAGAHAVAAVPPRVSTGSQQPSLAFMPSAMMPTRAGSASHPSLPPKIGNLPAGPVQTDSVPPVRSEAQVPVRTGLVPQLPATVAPVQRTSGLSSRDPRRKDSVPK
ncbi:hypothetical protein HK101_009878 [Irineochytrium annulatum]|nr:hypothetical protein HK101_009878 [Irineochytrium annulatum]